MASAACPSRPWSPWNRLESLESFAAAAEVPRESKAARAAMRTRAPPCRSGHRSIKARRMIFSRPLQSSNLESSRRWRPSRSTATARPMIARAVTGGSSAGALSPLKTNVRTPSSPRSQRTRRCITKTPSTRNFTMSPGFRLSGAAGATSTRSPSSIVGAMLRPRGRHQYGRPRARVSLQNSSKIRSRRRSVNDADSSGLYLSAAWSPRSTEPRRGAKGKS